jgi:hypothetical protein
LISSRCHLGCGEALLLLVAAERMIHKPISLPFLMDSLLSHPEPAARNTTTAAAAPRKAYTSVHLALDPQLARETDWKRLGTAIVSLSPCLPVSRGCQQSGFSPTRPRTKEPPAGEPEEAATDAGRGAAAATAGGGGAGAGRSVANQAHTQRRLCPHWIANRRAHSCESYMASHPAQHPHNPKFLPPIFNLTAGADAYREETLH